MKRIFAKAILIGVIANAAGMAISAPAHADLYGRRWHQTHWAQGHWIHDRHDGRLGWWWVIGDDWHFFLHPVAQPQMVVIQQPPVVVQQPPQVVVQQQPPAQVIVQQPPAAPAPAPVNPTLYYCRATGTYYPETMSCPNGWTPVVAGAPPAP